MVKSPLQSTNLIEASAGTGKTYTIAGLFLRLIIEEGLLVNEILTVTYTVKATEELRYRIRKQLRDAFIALKSGGDNRSGDQLIDLLAKKYNGDGTLLQRLRDAISDFDEAPIFTIHSFCQRMLLENAFESSSLFDTEFIVDHSELEKEVVHDFWRINFYTAAPLFIQYVFSKKYDPDYFLRLLGHDSIDPSFVIIPKVDKPDIATVEKPFLDAFEKMQSQWPLIKSEVEGILLNDKGLNRTKYKKGSIPLFISSMDDYLNVGLPFQRFDKFSRFTDSGITGAVKKGFDAPSHCFFNLCEEFEKKYQIITMAFNQYFLSLKSDFFDYSRKELIQRRKERNIRSYDDLLQNMHQALCSDSQSDLAKAIRRKYRAALIDEFQDTDPVQYDIFTTIFYVDDWILFLIGDPKQAIYKFRGADIFAYMKASMTMNSRYTLGTNWRSEAGLIGSVNTIFSRAANPFVFREIDFNPVKHASRDSMDILCINGRHESQMNIWFIDNKYADKKDGMINKGSAERVISIAVASEISRLSRLGSEGKAVIGDRMLRPGDIAILVRKNKQARLVQGELNKLLIPAVIYGAGSVFDTYEAIEIERVIAAIAEPGNEKRLKAALTTDMFGLTGNELHLLLDHENDWESRMISFIDYHNLWVKNGFIRMFSILVKREGIRERYLSFQDGERRLTNLLHCVEVLHRVEIENKLGMESIVKWIAEKGIRKDQSEENQIRLETDEDAVKILTIHGSKGLEYPVVFCPFSWEGSTVSDKSAFTFHDPQHDDNLTLDIGTGDIENIELSQKEELAENVRLLYVALTRAKHRCYLVWGKIAMAETSALAYIFHQSDKPNSDNPVLETGKRIKSMSYEIMLEDIKKLVDLSDGSISVSFLPQMPGELYKPFDSQPGDFNYRRFTCRILRDWKISSFSSLISSRSFQSELPDYRTIENKVSHPLALPKEGDGLTIFDFPAGPKAGLCLHEVFENLDFMLPDRGAAQLVISEKLKDYGFDIKWKEIVWNMVLRVLSVPLEGDQQAFALQSIDKADRLNEFEFNFPIKKITPKGLSDIFFKNGISRVLKNFPVAIENLGFKPVRGFLRGFIDMVFRFNGRFYIIDWKSNYLGGSVDNYSQTDIQISMEEHYYILQYYIYTVSLHQYLSMRMPGYNYKKDFGGVYYIFFRGIDPGYGPSYGIYRDLPSPDFITDLSKYMIGN